MLLASRHRDVYPGAPYPRDVWSLLYKLDHVRFGSIADISQCNRDVRFTPESGHGSGLAYTWRCYNALHESRRDRRSNRQVTAGINSPASVAGSPHSRRAVAITLRSSNSTATELGRLAGRAFAELKSAGQHRERERASRDVALWVISGHLRCQCHVRFTPESGHMQCNSICPPGARSGHSLAIRVFRRQAPAGLRKFYTAPGGPSPLSSVRSGDGGCANNSTSPVV